MQSARSTIRAHRVGLVRLGLGVSPVGCGDDDSVPFDVATRRQRPDCTGRAGRRRRRGHELERRTRTRPAMPPCSTSASRRTCRACDPGCTMPRPPTSIPRGAVPCADQAPPNSFDPEVQWSWDGGESYHTPLVANLTDDNGDGEHRSLRHARRRRCDARRPRPATSTCSTARPGTEHFAFDASRSTRTSRRRSATSTTTGSPRSWPRRPAVRAGHSSRSSTTARSSGRARSRSARRTGSGDRHRRLDNDGDVEIACDDMSCATTPGWRSSPPARRPA